MNGQTAVENVMKNEPEEKNRSERGRVYAYLVAGLLVSLLLVLLFSQAITMITAQMTYDATLEVKKNMLMENVENMISYMDACCDDYLEKNPGADDAELEQVIMETARRKIYSETHVDGTYMWVQKVLNYDGGDDYAVRLIHPNLSDTEGQMLSTNTVNPNGIKAYEVELEGVKKDGSIFLRSEEHTSELQSRE